MNKCINFLLTFLLLTVAAQAQEAEMADTMRSNGKIYVVVAIVLVILIGLVAYLISIDRKVSNLEKRLPEKK
ncbi:MAG: CcmD family protein [Cyclobacteriaceae bacterium]|jgi:CcmD family protein